MQEINTASRSTSDAGFVFTERDGRYETHKDGKVVLTLPVNRGRWTRWPDGVYLDRATQHILVVATARGTPYANAGATPTKERSAPWTRISETTCPRSRRSWSNSNG